MDSKQYNKVLSELGMTQGDAAEFLGVTIRTINNWANERSQVPEAVAKLLKLMVRERIRPEDVQ